MKCERIQISSSSECLNYGPIDPPECLPGKVEGRFSFLKKKKTLLLLYSVFRGMSDEECEISYSVLSLKTVRIS